MIAGAVITAGLVAGLLLYEWNYLQPSGWLMLLLAAALAAFLIAAAGCALFAVGRNLKAATSILIAFNILGSALIVPALLQSYYRHKLLSYGQILEEAAEPERQPGTSYRCARLNRLLSEEKSLLLAKYARCGPIPASYARTASSGGT